jgi:hypothetical protein
MVRGHLPAVEVHGQSHIALRREFFRLLFHPVIQAPPFMDHDDGSVRAGRIGKSEKTADGIIATLEFDRLGFGRTSTDNECSREQGDQEKCG